jgi:pyrroline-5-carboxylate reductase
LPTTKDIILAGCGNMGYAMLEAWIVRGGVAPQNIHVVEPVEALRSRAAVTGANAYGNIDEIDPTLQPAVIVVAVKPQVIAATLEAYRRFAGSAVFVSVAAGVAIKTLETCLGPCAVMRAMPNTPASIGRGMTVTFANPRVGTAQAQRVEELLAATGEVIAVSSEHLVDVATAISGSGPAYLFHFLECLASAGQALGLDRETALTLARQTIRGAAEMAATREDDPEALRREVTSPNGTTAAALEVLMGQNALMALMRDAAAAAYNRAVELSRAN